jgi:hypothetical protein
MFAGEYVAVERVENELGKADIVDQLWVYGNSFENNLVAVAVPHKVTLMGWASSQPSLSGLSYEEVCKRPEARTHVTQVLASTGGTPCYWNTTCVQPRPCLQVFFPIVCKCYLVSGWQQQEDGMGMLTTVDVMQSCSSVDMMPMVMSLPHAMCCSKGAKG